MRVCVIVKLSDLFLHTSFTFTLALGSCHIRELMPSPPSCASVHFSFVKHLITNWTVRDFIHSPIKLKVKCCAVSESQTLFRCLFTLPVLLTPLLILTLHSLSLSPHAQYGESFLVSTRGSGSLSLSFSLSPLSSFLQRAVTHLLLFPLFFLSCPSPESGKAAYYGGCHVNRAAVTSQSHPKYIHVNR